MMARKVFSSTDGDAGVDDQHEDAHVMRHISLFGGLKRRGHWRVGHRNLVVVVLGDADLDMTDADLDGPEVSLTLVCVLGGVDIRVPAATRVEAGGFALLAASVIGIMKSSTYVSRSAESWTASIPTALKEMPTRPIAASTSSAWRSTESRSSTSTPAACARPRQTRSRRRSL